MHQWALKYPLKFQSGKVKFLILIEKILNIKWVFTMLILKRTGNEMQENSCFRSGVGIICTKVLREKTKQASRSCSITASRLLSSPTLTHHFTGFMSKGTYLNSIHAKINPEAIDCVSSQQRLNFWQVKWHNSWKTLIWHFILLCQIIQKKTMQNEYLLSLL